MKQAADDFDALITAISKVDFLSAKMFRNNARAHVQNALYYVVTTSIIDRAGHDVVAATDHLASVFEKHGMMSALARDEIEMLRDQATTKARSFQQMIGEAETSIEAKHLGL